MPAIDGTRLLRDLYAVREIGKYKTGVHRPTFSPRMSKLGIGSPPA